MFQHFSNDQIPKHTALLREMTLRGSLQDKQHTISKTEFALYVGGKIQ